MEDARDTMAVMAAGGTPASETLVGTVQRVVYHDTKSRYTVMRLLVPGKEALVTAVGRMAAVEEGAEITVVGQWDTHPTHGPQFAFGHVQVEVPTTVHGIERRLRRYPGVKEVMAGRIVARFGLQTLEILETQPRRLLEVEGIGQRTFEKIVEHHRSHTGPVARIEAQLLELDLPPYLADAIFDRYGEQGGEVMRKQPYRMAREVRGIGFGTADRVARALGLATDSPDRIDAGILHVMEQAQSDGNCALPIDMLVMKAAASLSVPQEAVREGGERLVSEGELVLEHGNDGTPLCFPVRLVRAEEAVSTVLASLATAQRPVWAVPALPQHLSAGQVDAVAAVAQHGVVVLTGGPGTGKSTVVREIIELAQRHDCPLALAAPTGRAAKRLEQATGEPASTIHRLLEIQPETGRFTYGPHNPLPPGLLVVDETSMLDVLLAEALFGALTPEHRLLLVGDADQLQSVGAGNVLHDIMEAAQESEDSGLTVVRLTEIFRQAEGSSIVQNAHRILAGQTPVADQKGDAGEFFVVPARDAQHAHDLVVKMAASRIPEAYDLDGRTQVQVLTPMHKGRAGTEALNRSLQAHHTAGHPALELRTAPGAPPRRLCRGDRVMQTRNDYQKNVFNGDVGAVAEVNVEAASVVVDFEGVRVPYQGKELASLTLAYACSIHKSQGSEFPAVIVTLLPEHHVMLRRNLLYTAVTRARRLCVVVGEPRAIEQAVRRTDSGRRHTGLARRLRLALGASLGPWVEPDDESG
jgi:exodeoxyribonuclease V alpha subunit